MIVAALLIQKGCQYMQKNEDADFYKADPQLLKGS